MGVHYDLLNRLIKVEKNGILVAEYGYDPDGFRLVKKARGETIHYVFEGTEPILEKRITVESNVKIRSYIYALGKHLARVDGVIGDPGAPVYFYHTDHLGSVRVVTDLAGEVVWNADYFAFGTQYGENSSDFEEGHGFTGKEYDPDTGLYYFNARWYDSELGRFISEDQMGDPNNPNLYVYGRNNPLRFFDPTGLFTEEGKVELDIDINIDVNVNIPEIQLDKEINLDTTPVTAGKYGVVTEGDMLWDIAEREYGDPNLYPILQKVNNIEDPTQLQLGQKLYIPDINQISFTSKDGTTITSYSYVTFDPDTLLKGIRDKSVINKNVAIKGQEANFVQEFHEGKGYKNDYSTIKISLGSNINNNKEVGESYLNNNSRFFETFCSGAYKVGLGMGSIPAGYSITVSSGGLGALVGIGLMYYGGTQIVVGIAEMGSAFIGAPPVDEQVPEWFDLTIDFSY